MDLGGKILSGGAGDGAVLGEGGDAVDGFAAEGEGEMRDRLFALRHIRAEEETAIFSALFGASDIGYLALSEEIGAYDGVAKRSLGLQGQSYAAVIACEFERGRAVPEARSAFREITL